MSATKQIKVLIGISGCGKSTIAKEIYDADPSNHLIVNRDKIRELLFGYTEASIGEYYSRDDMYKCEAQVTKYEDLIIRQGLQDDKTVIVDATHLRSKYLSRFKNFNVPVHYLAIDVDINTCKKRVENRTRSVSPEIIDSQYEFMVYVVLEAQVLINRTNPKLVV